MKMYHRPAVMVAKLAIVACVVVMKVACCIARVHRMMLLGDLFGQPSLSHWHAHVLRHCVAMVSLPKLVGLLLPWREESSISSFVDCTMAEQPMLITLQLLAVQAAGVILPAAAVTTETALVHSVADRYP
jgi:hypothetical protein